METDLGYILKQNLKNLTCCELSNRVERRQIGVRLRFKHAQRAILWLFSGFFVQQNARSSSVANSSV